MQHDDLDNPNITLDTPISVIQQHNERAEENLQYCKFQLNKVQLFKMEPVCYVCQEYENDVGHITSLCPNKECKKCGQKGHFGYECESLENISIKKENCNIVEDNNHKIKTENYNY